MKTIRSEPLAGAPPPHRAGFTLTELLVIVAVVALLACLRWSALASAQDQTLVAQCAGNLRQFALALQIYGSEYDDKLPSDDAGYFPWDIPWKTGTEITKWVPWRLLYCPGRGWRYSDADNARLWTYSPTNRVIGYATTFSGTVNLITTNKNSTLTPQPIPYMTTFLPAPRASERVLLADATVSEPGQNHVPPLATYNWGGTQGVHMNRVPSAHLEGQVPRGCNVGMLDGHVEWRKFPLMLPRTFAGGFPVFWW